MAVLEGIVVINREKNLIFNKKKIIWKKKGSLGSVKSEKKSIKEIRELFRQKNATTDPFLLWTREFGTFFSAPNGPKRHNFRLPDKNKQILFS